MSLSVSVRMNVNCHHCIQCEQEAVNISVRFMLHSCHIGFTVNRVGADKWDAGSLVSMYRTRMHPNYRIPICHFPISPELSITFWSTFTVIAPLLMADFLPIHFPPHEHLFCVCHFPVSKADSADHTGKGLDYFSQ